MQQVIATIIIALFSMLGVHAQGPNDTGEENSNLEGLYGNMITVDDKALHLDFGIKSGLSFESQRFSNDSISWDTYFNIGLTLDVSIGEDSRWGLRTGVNYVVDEEIQIPLEVNYDLSQKWEVGLGIVTRYKTYDSLFNLQTGQTDSLDDGDRTLLSIRPAVRYNLNKHWYFEATYLNQIDSKLERYGIGEKINTYNLNVGYRF